MPMSLRAGIELTIALYFGDDDTNVYEDLSEKQKQEVKDALKEVAMEMGILSHWED